MSSVNSNSASVATPRRSAPIEVHGSRFKAADSLHRRSPVQAGCGSVRALLSSLLRRACNVVTPNAPARAGRKASHAVDTMLKTLAGMQEGTPRSAAELAKDVDEAMAPLLAGGYARTALIEKCVATVARSDHALARLRAGLIAARPSHDFRLADPDGGFQTIVGVVRQQVSQRLATQVGALLDQAIPDARNASQVMETLQQAAQQFATASGTLQVDPGRQQALLVRALVYLVQSDPARRGQVQDMLTALPRDELRQIAQLKNKVGCEELARMADVAARTQQLGEEVESALNTVFAGGGLNGVRELAARAKALASGTDAKPFEMLQDAMSHLLARGRITADQANPLFACMSGADLRAVAAPRANGGSTPLGRMALDFMQQCQQIARTGFEQTCAQLDGMGMDADPAALEHHVAQLGTWMERVRTMDPSGASAPPHDMVVKLHEYSSYLAPARSERFVQAAQVVMDMDPHADPQQVAEHAVIAGARLGEYLMLPDPRPAAIEQKVTQLKEALEGRMQALLMPADLPAGTAEADKNRARMESPLTAAQDTYAARIGRAINALIENDHAEALRQLNDAVKHGDIAAKLNAGLTLGQEPGPGSAAYDVARHRKNLIDHATSKANPDALGALARLFAQRSVQSLESTMRALGTALEKDDAAELRHRGSQLTALADTLGTLRATIAEKSGQPQAALADPGSGIDEGALATLRSFDNITIALDRTMDNHGVPRFSPFGTVDGKVLSTKDGGAVRAQELVLRERALQIHTSLMLMIVDPAQPDAYIEASMRASSFFKAYRQHVETHGLPRDDSVMRAQSALQSRLDAALASRREAAYAGHKAQLAAFRTALRGHDLAGAMQALRGATAFFHAVMHIEQKGSIANGAMRFGGAEVQEHRDRLWTQAFDGAEPAELQALAQALDSAEVQQLRTQLSSIGEVLTTSTSRDHAAQRVGREMMSDMRADFEQLNLTLNEKLKLGEQAPTAHPDQRLEIADASVLQAIKQVWNLELGTFTAADGTKKPAAPEMTLANPPSRQHLFGNSPWAKVLDELRQEANPGIRSTIRFLETVRAFEAAPSADAAGSVLALLTKDTELPRTLLREEIVSKVLAGINQLESAEMRAIFTEAREAAELLLYTEVSGRAIHIDGRPVSLSD